MNLSFDRYKVYFHTSSGYFYFESLLANIKMDTPNYSCFFLLGIAFSNFLLWRHAYPWWSGVLFCFVLYAAKDESCFLIQFINLHYLMRNWDHEYWELSKISADLFLLFYCYGVGPSLPPPLIYLSVITYSLCSISSGWSFPSIVCGAGVLDSLLEFGFIDEYFQLLFAVMDTGYTNID